MKPHHTFAATGLVALLALTGVTAAIAADPAGDPPPKIAFLANGIVPADALAAGPIAGQLGAPVFTTQPDNLSTPASEGLAAANPELVLVLGGPGAIHDRVLAQVSVVTDLPIKTPNSRPDSGIVRVAGQDRFETAAIVANLLANYDAAYLGVDLTADDSDLLDGKDSSAFQPAGNYLGNTGKAADSDKLDGRDSTEFLGNTEKAADSDKLDGRDSTEFLGNTEKAADSELLEGQTATEVAFPATLPSGQTLRGVLLIDAHATASGQMFGSHITYTTPLPAPLVGYEYISGAPTSNCPGSVSDPQAAPGHLCVYQQYRDTTTTSAPFLLHSGKSPFGGPFWRFGALLESTSASAGDIFLQAAWAVTPPEPSPSAATATERSGSQSPDGRD